MYHTLHRLLIATLAIGVGTFGQAQENGSYTFGVQATLSLSGPSTTTNLNIFSVVEPITGLSTSDDNRTEVYAGFLGATGAGDAIVSLGDLTVAENAEAGTIVGELNATGLEGDQITYEFATGLGDGNNSLFTLDSNGTLRTNTALDYEMGSPLRVRILARNENGDTVETPFEVEVEDVFEPEQPSYAVDSAANLEMLWVEPGTFTMGSPETEVGRLESEIERNITLTRGFYLGKYEVTQAEYEVVMAGNNELDSDGNLFSANPSIYSGYPNRPVEGLSYDGLQVFLTRLNLLEADKLPAGWGYVLPTEAQWEYACRAGTTTAYSFGDEINASYANYEINGVGTGLAETTRVGQYLPNPWGFYDMHGNVWEFIEDINRPYDAGNQIDPENPASSSDTSFLIRGGSWAFGGSYLRSARRGANDGNGSSGLGFRLALRYNNKAPIDLNSTAALTIAENEPVGTRIGEFNATDPEGGMVTYNLVDGENNNSLFNLDSNGTLRTASVLDFESGSVLTLTVEAIDELNDSRVGNFTVLVIDNYEDTDGDGFRDSLEASTGSDLNDPHSTPFNYGLVAWYPFDGNASDMSGNGNHGTVNGATLGTDRHGVAGKAYSFDGVDDYIDLGNSSLLNPSESMSISSWIKCSSLKYAPIVERYEAFTGKRSYFLNLNTVDSSHSLGFYTYRESTEDYGQVSGFAGYDGSLNLGLTYHVVGTFDLNGGIMFFVNGSMISHNSVYAPIQQSDQKTTVGGLINSAGKFFHGTIDDIRIYERALSADEVELLYRAESPNHFVDSAKDLEMIWVEPGTFTMGQNGVTNAEPEHQVTLTKGFYLGKYEVTQAQYEAVMTGNTETNSSGDLISATPSSFDGNPNRPVEQVSWEDIQVFLTRLNEQQSENLPNGWAYVLPTEAQWEYACRAGTTTAYSWGDSISASDANYKSNIGQTADVGQYSANPWGFFDMHGNVLEWTADWYAAYSSIAQIDPDGPTAGPSRVYRGGSWLNGGTELRLAERSLYPIPETRSYIIGFRVGFQQVNQAPTDLNSTTALTITENQPVGTVVGEFNATDLEGGAITYHFVSGENNNSLFTLETNGTLRNATTLDYETDASSYTITVQAKDELNATTEGNFTVSLEDDLSDNTVELKRSHILSKINQGESVFVSVSVEGEVSVLVRALGPSLSSEVISDAAIDPAFSIYNIDSVEIATNDDWQSGANSATITSLGEAPTEAFEAAEIISLQTGTYTVVLNDRQLGGSVALELVNLDPDGRGRIISLNTTGRVSAGGTYSQTVELHGALPGRFLSMAKGKETLEVFGITDALTNPALNLFRMDENEQAWELLAENDDWEEHYRSTEVGQSPQSSASGSKEAALVADLVAGEYMWLAEDVNTSVSGFIDFTWSEYGAGDLSYGFAPVELGSLSALSVEENQDVGTLVGEFNATDPDGDELTYHFVSGENNNSLFSLDLNGTLRSASTYDYEGYPHLDVEILARDSRGAEVMGEFVVQIGDLDDEVPVLALNGDAYISHEAGDAYIDTNASWSDNVDGTGQVMGTGVVDVSTLGEYELSYNYTDEAGNVGVTVTRTVIVVDTTIPVITLNGVASVTHEAGGAYLDANATWADIVDGSGVVVGTGGVNVSTLGTYELSYNYTDEAGNVADTVNRIVNVVDTTIPVITLNGEANMTHEAGGAYLDANATWADIVDGSGVVVGTGEVDISTPGEFELSYNYTDEAGNVADTVTRTINVVDTTIPVITLNGDHNITLEAGGAYLDANATWADIVDGSGVVVGTGEVNVSTPGTYELSYNYTDEAGNVADTVTRTINVVDTTIPVITLNGDHNITLEAGGAYLDANATWADIVDGSGVVVGTGEMNVSIPGTYELSYNYTDEAGNVAVTVTRTVNVVDTTIPVITLNGDHNITHEAGGAYHDANATWADIVDGSGVVVGTGEVDISTPGEYELSYNYTDQAGNVAVTVTRTVNVVDTTIPVITLNGDNYITHEAGGAYIDANATWADIVDGSGVVVGTGEVNVSTPGEYELSYNYTDEAGNVADTVTRTINVVDTTGPVIELSVQNPLVHGYRTAFTEPVAEAYDLVDGNVSELITVSGEVDPLVLGEHELIYRVSDSHGNEAVPVVLRVLVDDGEFDRRPYNLVGEDWLGVEENQPVGTYVGEFNATDPDLGELTYSLVVGEGGEDNERFLMEENGTLRTNEVFDYEQLEEYRIRVRAEVVTGHGVEGIFVVKVWDQVAPVVETLIPQGRDGGMVYVGGRILDAGSSTGWSTGVFVSFDLPFYSEDKEGVMNLAQGDNETEYGLEFFPGEDVKKVYVMAYAQNGEGVGYGLLEEYENVSRGEYDKRGLGDFWTGAKPLDGYLGWWDSGWFGSYYKSDNGWWYHVELGWVYPSGSAGEGLWLWKEGLNWVWTKENIYPFLYSHDTGSWYYFYGEIEQNRMLYDYRLMDWKYLDDRGVDESKGEEIVR